MKRRRTQGRGRIYRRTSRHTGKTLPTWWLSYYRNGAEIRESAETTDRQAALDLLRTRQDGVREGTVVDPARERLSVDALLDGLLAYYQRKGLRSLPSVTSQVKAWRGVIGATRAAGSPASASTPSCRAGRRAPCSRRPSTGGSACCGGRSG